MKKKYNKIGINFSDKITLKNLKIVIGICILFSILFEFIPSWVNVCELFNYCSWIVSLQPHKDFFVNISLGCLGSAIISYIMLFISIDLKEKEEKDKILQYKQNIVVLYGELISLLDFIIEHNRNDRDTISYIETDMKTKKEALKQNIEQFIFILNRTDIEDKKTSDFLEICKNKLLPIIIEIDTFFYVYEGYKNGISDKSYFLNKTNKVYKILLEELEIKYNITELRYELLNCVSVSSILKEGGEKIGDAFKEYFTTKLNAQCVAYYSLKIYGLDINREKEKPEEGNE